jgi:hypothetical protein
MNDAATDCLRIDRASHRHTVEQQDRRPSSGVFTGNLSAAIPARAGISTRSGCRHSIPAICCRCRHHQPRRLTNMAVAAGTVASSRQRDGHIDRPLSLAWPKLGVTFYGHAAMIS